MSTEKLSFANSRRDYLALWEIASVVTSGLIAGWVVLAFVGRSKLVMAVPLGLVFALMLISHRERGESTTDIGLRFDNFRAAIRLLILPTAVAVIAIVLIAWLKYGSIFAAPWRYRFLTLPLWAMVQQYVLNGYINRRAQIVFGKGTSSIVLVAAVFALFHLPNVPLAALTFIGGLFWAAVYQRQPNLFALALSQAVTSLTLALTLSPAWLNGMRVAFKYFGLII